LAGKPFGSKQRDPICLPIPKAFGVARPWLYAEAERNLWILLL
jgi:hypothetical protein